MITGGIESAASENEDSHPKQTKDDRKCSGENGLIFTMPS
jgi:hypothetical protein